MNLSRRMRCGKLFETQGKFVVTFKWMYKIKNGADESIEKYKVRFMARGFS